MKRAAVLALLGALVFASAAAGTADQDWEQIEEQEAKPPGKFATREQARVLALQRLGTQEKALRDFSRAYPNDPRSFDAKLRLAHLLAVRGDLEASTKAAAESRAVLDALSKTVPPERAADLAFAKISLSMRNVRSPDAATRSRLFSAARSFQSAYPADRRVGRLLAEIATLFDADPPQMAALLKEADGLTSDPEVKARIADDLKRIAQFGRPVELRFSGPDGREFDVAGHRGKIVVICWFADWSPPGMLALRGVREAVAGFSRSDVQGVGVSLDSNRTTLASNMKTLQLDWPVAFDGKGWESPLARSYGINALPTVWILDRTGKLRVLNAQGDVGAILRQLLRE